MKFYKNIIAGIMVLSILVFLLPDNSVITSADKNGTETAAEYNKDAPVIKIGTAFGKQDEIVQVKIDMLNNPGIMTLGLEISYDNTKLKLLKVQDCKNLETLTFTTSSYMNAMPYKLLWDGTDENTTFSGTIATLIFVILEDAEDGESQVDIAIDTRLTVNSELDKVNFTGISGFVYIGDKAEMTTTANSLETTESENTTTKATTTTVPVTTTTKATTTTAPETTTPSATTTSKSTTTEPQATATPSETTTESSEIKYGDINNDSKIDLKDVVLIRRYIVGGWDIEIDEKAADVNHDDLVDLKDVVILRRYIVGGWGIELN